MEGVEATCTLGGRGEGNERIRDTYTYTNTIIGDTKTMTNKMDHLVPEIYSLNINTDKTKTTNSRPK